MHRCRLLPKQFCLCRAEVPGADIGALFAFQSASFRCAVAAAFALLGKQLLARHRDGRQVEKEQIPEIDPDTGVLTADVAAVGAGGPAEAIHDRKDRCESTPDLLGRHTGLLHGLTMVPHEVPDGGIGLAPQGRGVPWNERKRGIHGGDIYPLHLFFKYGVGLDHSSGMGFSLADRR